METKKMNVTEELVSYTRGVIAELERDRMFPAAHIYTSTLNSFVKFMKAKREQQEAEGEGTSLLMTDVFQPSRLKEYEQWLVQRTRKPPTVSTYMRTLHAVYYRWMPPGSPDHNPRLFDNVYTKVEPQTKRALKQQQMGQLLNTEFETLTEKEKRVMAYFLLMFLLRGMPFIDLAHLRKIDMQGNRIVYCRHKTGKQITVELSREARLLIREYGTRDSQSIYLFPILDAGIQDVRTQYQSYQKALRDFNRSLALLMRTLLPEVRISTYTARHTWATLTFHSGMPVGYISQSLGHSSLRVTETYLKPIKDECIDKANRQLIAYIKKEKWKDRREIPFANPQ